MRIALGPYNPHPDAIGGVNQHIRGIINYSAENICPVYIDGGVINSLNPFIFFQLWRKNDILHAHGSGWYAQLNKIVSKISQKPFIITSHGLYDNYKSNLSPKDWNWAKRENLCLINAMKNCDVLISVSRFCAHQMEKYGIYSDYIIPNGIDPTDFQKYGMSRKLNQDDEVTRIIFVGKLEKFRNPLLLINAIPFLSFKNEVIIIGSGSLEKDIVHLISKHGIQKNVSVIPELPHNNLLDLFSKSDIVINCCNIEIFGIANIEAMASGCSVVAPDSGAHKEYIQDGRTGYIYLHNNLENLVSKIEEAKVNSCSVGNNARKYIMDKYSWNKIVPNIDKIYAEFA